MDRQSITMLILLDLSAAFDLIDHARLLSRMEHDLGISGIPLAWFTSYLSNRKQCVRIDDKQSEPTPMHWGVPQGSVLGPILFLIYMLPLGALIREHGLRLHMYADDTQVYISVCPVSQSAVDADVVQMETCVGNIQAWMDVNMLKLNSSKTEIKLFGTPSQLAKFHLPSMVIAKSTVLIQHAAVRNLGVMFDTHLKMDAHVKSLTRTCNHHLSNLRKVRRFLTVGSTTTMARNLVLTRLATPCCSEYPAISSVVFSSSRIRQPAW